MIRRYRPGDTDILIALFRDTVRHVNLCDYTQEQVMAWAPDAIDAAEWAGRQARNKTFVAEIAGAIAGFAELQDDSHIHMLFVHKNHQRQGVARALLVRLEDLARQGGATRLTADVSITARPAFERRGFRAVSPQTVTARGVRFRNFKMEKAL